MVAVVVVEADEESKRNLGLLEKSNEEAMDGFVGFVVGLTRRRKTKKRATKTRRRCNFECWISKIDDDDDGVVLGSAMQIGIRNHPPRAHKDSISMNQLQG